MKLPAKTVMQRIQLVTVPVMLVVLLILHRWLGVHVPPSRLLLLEGAFAVIIAWRVGSVVLVRRRRDIGDDRPGDWYLNSLTGFWLVAVFLVIAFWLAMPYTEPAQQVLAVLASQLPVTASAMGTVRRPGDGVRGWPGTAVPLVIPSGIILYFLYFGGTYAVPVIILVALLCGLQLTLRELLQAAVTQAWRAEAEAAAQRDARTRFLASASHDLGQPLHSARLFFDQAVRGTDPARKAAASGHAEAAFDMVEHQLDQMNNYMRLEAGEVVARLGAVAIGPILARVAARAQALSGTGPAVALVHSGLQVRADPDLLERALTNLADNAVRHARAGRLLIGARRRRDRVRLWVIDDGVGVAAADAGTLFDDYVRGSDHGDEQRGGFGLGLASVRRIAALLGGSTGIDPRWHRGTAFYIDLAAETTLVDGCSPA